MDEGVLILDSRWQIASESAENEQRTIPYNTENRMDQSRLGDQDSKSAKMDLRAIDYHSLTGTDVRVLQLRFTFAISSVEVDTPH